MNIFSNQYVYVYRLNSRKIPGRKPGMLAAKSVSKKNRTFHSINADRLKQLKTRTMKKRSETKMWWGVRAYKEWRMARLNDENKIDYDILESDLSDVKLLCKDKFENALCIFIAEVKKVNGSDYPGKTLYQLAVSIQRFLVEGGLNWKLVDGPDFKNFRVVLDNIMKERAKDNIGNTKRQANMISFDCEEYLWDKGFLGEHEPNILRNTVLFMIGINCGLRAGDEHYDLRRDSPDKPSQFSFQRNEKGQRCVVYTEDTVTKTNDGGLGHMRKDRKIVWIYPSLNVNRCPVRLIDKYLSLCPEVGPKSKNNFYLRSLEKINPAQWYGNRVLGINAIRKTVTTMLKDAKLDGFFTNHSLRRSGTTRLFQAGIDRKIIKEFTGHVSDAVDQYQITSDDQRRQVSAVIAGDNVVRNSVECQDPIVVKGKSVNKKVPESVNSLELTVSDKRQGSVACACKMGDVKLSETERIGDLVNKMLEGKQYNKATIKLEIEFHN